MDANFFISRSEREFDEINNRIILTARDRLHADGLRRCCTDIAKWAGGKDISIHWAEDRGNPYLIPGELATCEMASLPEDDRITTTLSHQKPALPEPQSKDDELIIWAQTNPKPTGICSINTGKVLFMNSAMPKFCGLAYDLIAVPDIATQFAKKDEREPTNLEEFNERLIKDKVINGSMKAFRTSGAFGNFYGRYTFTLFNGIPVRISEYEAFEAIK